MNSVFIELGVDRGLMAMGPIVPLKHPLVNDFYKLLLHIKGQNKKAVILWDVDFDGIMSGYICNYTIREILGEDNVINKINKTKTHGITEQLLGFIASQGDIGLLIVVDAGTNDTTQIHQLLDMKVPVVVIDHHQIDSRIQREGFILINSNELEYGKNVPGARIVNDTMNELRRLHRLKSLTAFDELTIACIISDVCPRDPYNVNLLLKYMLGEIKPSPLFNNIVKKNRVATVSNLVSITSKFNALIRRLGPERVMELMLQGGLRLKSEVSRSSLYKEDNEKIIKGLIEKSKIYNLRNMSILFIDEVKVLGSYSRNYLGILATKLASVKKKPVFVIATNKVNFENYELGQQYCYSARDPFNRDLLTVVKGSGLDANGHPPAFGGILKSNFVECLMEVDFRLNDGIELVESPYRYTIDLVSPRDLITTYDKELNSIALWNSIQLTQNKIGFKIKLNCVINKVEKFNRLIFDEFNAITFDKTIQVGDDVFIFPEWNNKLEFHVKK